MRADMGANTKETATYANLFFGRPVLLLAEDSPIFPSSCARLERAGRGFAPRAGRGAVCGLDIGTCYEREGKGRAWRRRRKEGGGRERRGKGVKHI